MLSVTYLAYVNDFSPKKCPKKRRKNGKLKSRIWSKKGVQKSVDKTLFLIVLELKMVEQIAEDQ